jgi:hypothetical protein
LLFACRERQTLQENKEMRIKSKKIKMRKLTAYRFSKSSKEDQNKWLSSKLFGCNRVYLWEFPRRETEVKPLRTTAQLRASIANAYEMKEHTPKSKANDWVGVEIECYLPRRNFDENSGDCDGSCRDNCECYYCPECNQHDDDRECNCECDESCGGLGEGYISDVKNKLKKLNIRYLDVSDDGSLRPDRFSFGVEIKIMFNTSNPKPLEKLCEWLNDNEATIDTKCGLHVHLDKSYLTAEQKALFESNLRSALPVMAKLVSPSRLTNSYCAMRVSKEKYSAVNLTSYTNEVRLHNGTTNYEKIYNWCLFLQKIKDASIDLKKFCGAKKLNAYVKTALNLSEENYQFLLKRQAKFKLLDDSENVDGSEESAA